MLRLGACRPVHVNTSFCRWVFIRSCKINSDALPDIDTKPTKWSPPTGTPAPPGVKPMVPFHVRRSHNRNLPVYTDYRSGRSQVITMIKNIDGDVVEMERQLRKFLNHKGLRSRADKLIGRIELHGNHRDKVNEWLKRMGF